MMSSKIDWEDLFKLSSHKVPEKTEHERILEMHSELATQMCKCLGLDANLVTSLTIKFKGGETPTVICEMLPEIEDFNEDIQVILKKFKLIPIGADVKGERLIGEQ
jgi:hypothetical protein